MNVCANISVRARVFMQVQGCACVIGNKKREREREQGDRGWGRERGQASTRASEERGRRGTAVL